MIRYVAKGKSAWEYVDDEPHALQTLCDSGKYEFMTVLAVSEIVNEETTDYDALKYKGPLYFDIDIKGDIDKATESTQDLVEMLLGSGVFEPYILIYASGSKGYHVMVHPKVFSSGRALRNLPTIYKEVATKFLVDGLDFVVYSEKRGRMWRIPNFKRQKGTYKVSISHEELASMTKEKYAEYISTPRPLRFFPETITASSQMRAIFNEAKKSRLKKLKAQLNSKGLGAEHFKQLTEIPNCIEKIRAWEGINSEEHFNNIILQVVTYIKAAELDEDRTEILITDISNNGESRRYKTAQERKMEISGKLGYVNRSDYKFDCNYIRSVLDERPCAGCKLEFACMDDGVEESEEGTLGILSTNIGYFRGDTQISTFILKPINRFLDCDSGLIDKTVGVEVQVSVENSIVGSTRLTESAFQSKSELLKQLSGYGKAVFLGSDQDVQKIKHNLFHVADRTEIGDIMETFTAGIMETRKGSRTLVYVEPKFSIDQFKTRDTHLLVSDPAIPPEIRDIDLPTKEEAKEFEAVLRSLLAVNEPVVVAQILGWVSACHLRTHFSCGAKGAREFPLLFLTGNAGTGKTQSAGLFMNLHCVDYLVKDSPPSLASITEWALIDTCSSTTTTPRLLDEFNRGKMGLKRYNAASEIMKMSWGSQTINRGTLSRGRGTKIGRTGARTVTIPITSPLMILGEQKPMEPALLQRSCIVQLKVTGRRGREKDFRNAVNHTGLIQRVGKAMVYQALRKPLSYAYELRGRYESKMPVSFEPRTRITYQIILGGLDFFQDTLNVIGININPEIDELREAVLSMLSKEGTSMSMVKAITEIDRAMNVLAILAMQSDNDAYSSSIKMTAGVMYYRTKTRLYLDLPICHAMFSQECRRSGRVCVIESAAMMKEMLSEEVYCVAVDVLCRENPDFAARRKVVELDLEKMRGKDIEADYFSYGDIFTNSVQQFGFDEDNDGKEIEA